jgi:hypothetical protein
VLGGRSSEVGARRLWSLYQEESFVLPLGMTSLSCSSDSPLSELRTQSSDLRAPTSEQRPPGPPPGTIRAVFPVTASPAYDVAIHAVVELLAKVRAEALFLGSIARAAYLGGGAVEGGSIDAVALLAPEQKNHVAMMANNRGFHVDRSEIEASEELDLIPLKFDDIRVHILVASNALYGRMIADGVPATVVGLPARIPKMEDYALLLQMSSDVTGLMALASSPEFDRDFYNRKLVSIGLAELVIPE